MDTETLDKLYLEWSQFTGAKTKREIAYRGALARIKSLDEKNVVKFARQIADEALRVV